VSWTAANDAFVDYYEVQHKLQGDTDYFSVNVTGTSTTIPLTEDGETYDVRVRSVNQLGVRSAFVSTTGSSAGDTTAPAAPTSLTATGITGGIELDWTNPADTDFASINIYESADAQVGNALFLVNVRATRFERLNLPPDTTRYYWVSALDYTGNESDKTGPANATSLFITNADLGDASVAFENLDSTVTTRITDIEADVTSLESTKVDITDFNITVDYQQQLEDATELLAQNALQVALNASSLESRVNDAGITVDPTTGAVTIQGLSAIENRVSTAEIDLDAVEAQLTLTATTTYVDNAIAAAQLPEEQCRL